MPISETMAFWYAGCKEQDLRSQGAIGIIVWVVFSKALLGLGKILSLALSEICALKTMNCFWDSYLIFVYTN